MEVRAPWLFLLLMDICLLGLTTFSKGEECGSPPVPLNARISTENVTLTPGTSIVYTCDSGYELFGSGDKLTCGENGQWSGQMPFCGVDVAYRKPANQSTTARGGDASHGNDGNWNTLHEGKFCTETRKEPSPWWRVDLLRPYDVRTIRIVTPSGGQHRVQDLEIRVGNSTVVSRNRLCAWQPGNLEPGVKQDLSCARASVGRYVFIQMVGVEGALSLCEVQIFTTSETSPERCETSKSSDVVRSFDSLCYEFQLKQGSNFQGARKRCQSLGGDLVHDISNVTKNFLVGELEMMRGSMTTQLVWIGANKEPGSSNTWHWVGGGAVATPMWGPDQPNNYNGEQNCVVLDGGRGWLWNDVGCNLNYLPWVCQYDPPACGSPDKAVNTTIERPVNGYGVGFILKYRCPNDSMIVGNDTRVCQKDGAWSGVAPTCRYVDCGALQSIHNGRVDLLDRRTTYNATALYVCNENYTLVGAPRRTCDAEGRWTGDVPSCLYMFCPKPEVPINGTVNLTKALVVESVAIYSCHRGHHLVGQSERVCLIGGKWTGTVPTCKYTDCGDPRPVDHGIFVLPSNSTLYGAEVVFLCSDDYELKGPEKRVCTENGTWSEEDPTCQIISCGEPDFRQGSYVVVDGFTIKSTVQYICELGHVMEGEPNRTCEADGKWSADAPRCRFVECGHVQPVLHGQVDFLNFTTHLNSIVNYSCAPGYRLNGNGTRVCETSGRWSGTTPFCEEIRCTEPNRPPNSVLSVSGNDRSGDGDTFKVGSTVQFRCEKGYTFHGGTVLTCERDGIWTGAPPVCLYVDCLFPEPITNGEFTLLSNTTYYASVVEYVCDDHYEIVGNARRTCLENGTWEGSPPKCHEINCGAPDKPPSVSSIEVANYTVDSVAVYRCSVGQKIVGNATRVCLRTGQWSSSAPTCEWVDCGRPGSPQNGEIYLLNQSTTYMSVMEYHCFFGYKLVGPAIRSCHVNGKWNGVDGKCELDTTNTDVLGENSLTKPVASGELSIVLDRRRSGPTPNGTEVEEVAGANGTEALNATESGVGGSNDTGPLVVGTSRPVAAVNGSRLVGTGFDQKQPDNETRSVDTGQAIRGVNDTSNETLSVTTAHSVSPVNGTADEGIASRSNVTDASEMEGNGTNDLGTEPTSDGPDRKPTTPKASRERPLEGANGTTPGPKVVERPLDGANATTPGTKTVERPLEGANGTTPGLKVVERPLDGANATTPGPKPIERPLEGTNGTTPSPKMVERPLEGTNGTTPGPKTVERPLEGTNGTTPAPNTVERPTVEVRSATIRFGGSALNKTTVVGIHVNDTAKATPDRNETWARVTLFVEMPKKLITERTIFNTSTVTRAP